MTVRVQLDMQKLLGYRLAPVGGKRPLSAMIGSKLPPAISGVSH